MVCNKLRGTDDYSLICYADSILSKYDCENPILEHIKLDYEMMTTDCSEPGAFIVDRSLNKIVVDQL